MRPRLSARLLVVISTVAALAASVLPPTSVALAAVGDDCPDVVDLASLSAGDPLSGLTVSSGTTPDPFTGTVVGVLEDALGPERDLVIAELSSPAVDRYGVWAGMSGSPVYDDAGDIVGAVAFTFTWDKSPLAGITPAADMMRILGYEGRGAAATAQDAVTVDLSAADRRALARVSRVELSSVPSRLVAHQLRIPVSVSGLLPRRLERLSRDAERADLPFIIHSGAAPSGVTDPATPEEIASITPGGNFGTALSYGDVTFGGVGTVTMICDGQVLALGHPFLFSAASQYSAHAADALTVVEDSGFGGSFKFSKLGGIVGRVDQDRLAGIAGPVGGTVRSTPVRTNTVIFDGQGNRLRSRQGATFVTRRQFLPDVTLLHQWANIDTLRDGFAPGSAKHTWTIVGRYRGKDWTLRRTNRYVSDFDISFESVWELYGQLSRIINFGNVRIDSVDVRNDVITQRELLKIQRLLVFERGRYRDLRKLAVRPGQWLQLQVVFTDARDRLVRRHFAYRVPTRREPARGRLEVSGRGVGDGGFFFFADGGSSVPPKSRFGRLLTRLGNAPRNDQMVIRSSLDYLTARRPVRASRVVRFDRVVRGQDGLILRVVPAGRRAPRPPAG